MIAPSWDTKLTSDTLEKKQRDDEALTGENISHFFC